MRAVIFDFDGVLVNSEPLHFRALRDSLATIGVVIDEAEYASTYLAYDDRESVRLALEAHGITPDPSVIARLAGEKARQFDVLLGQVPFFPGSRELVRALAAEMPVAIASGALRGEIERILDAGEMLDAFVTIVGADDVSHGKPHPEPYLAALGRLQADAPDLRADDCVVVEDSMAGIAAARAAGMRVVGITNTYPAERLAAAHRVIQTFEGLSPDGLFALVPRS